MIARYAEVLQDVWSEVSRYVKPFERRERRGNSVEERCGDTAEAVFGQLVRVAAVTAVTLLPYLVKVVPRVVVKAQLRDPRAESFEHGEDRVGR